MCFFCKKSEVANGFILLIFGYTGLALGLILVIFLPSHSYLPSLPFLLLLKTTYFFNSAFFNLLNN